MKALHLNFLIVHEPMYNTVLNILKLYKILCWLHWQLINNITE